MSAFGKIVCVTGASGFIASWLVKFLLQRGYTVNASVRNLDDPNKIDHLLALEGAKDRLHLFKAELLEEGSFDAAVNGCDGVFHTASPVKFIVDDDPQVMSLIPQQKMQVFCMFVCFFGSLPKKEETQFPRNTEIIDPAVKGTLNVLGSCAKTPSVKRVVLTSSIAAVMFDRRPKTPDVVVDETWFSDPELCKETKLWYLLSKTLAEDVAWKFAKEKCMDLVAINPGMVIGPLLQPTLNTTAATVLSLINGAKTYPDNNFGWVNVKDVAMAHIQAFEIPSACGRYILVQRVVHYSQIVDILRNLYPSFQLPDECADVGKLFTPAHQFSKEKAKSLGIDDYISLEDGLKETVESLKEKKFLAV